MRAFRARLRIPVTFATVALAATIAVAGCGSDTSSSEAPTSTSTASATTGNRAGTTDGITAEEQAGILWMREEEKLARDVYTVLGDRWNLPIFTNIAASEQTHMDAVATLIDGHGLVDPAASTAPGEFTQPELQRLYDALVDQGSRSAVDALTVGASIEDLDLADLASRATDTPDIARVYANLERGSRNHLRAFTGQLEAAGVSYTPTHITPEQYDAIVTTAVERGGG
jgi:hypothetical protein